MLTEAGNVLILLLNLIVEIDQLIWIKLSVYSRILQGSG